EGGSREVAGRSPARRCSEAAAAIVGTNRPGSRLPLGEHGVFPRLDLAFAPARGGAAGLARLRELVLAHEAIDHGPADAGDLHHRVDRQEPIFETIVDLARLKTGASAADGCTHLVLRGILPIASI